MSGVLKAKIGDIEVEFEPNYKAMTQAMPEIKPLSDDELLFAAST